MAPRTRGKRRRNDASSLPPRVEPASDDVCPLSTDDNLSDNQEPGSIGHGANNPQSNERETSASQSYHALVLGEVMLVPQTIYDPDTYDPNERIPRTPEPEPYEAETYAAWGRKYFGEEWFALRKTMLEERNIYLEYDPVYKERQRALRVMEHQVEGRPFRPCTQIYGNNLDDEGWKRLWTRISKKLGIPSSNPLSPPPNDNDSDLSGYDTYPPTPESREPTPIPKDPWE